MSTPKLVPVGSVNVEPTPAGYASIAMMFAEDLVKRVGPINEKNKRESQEDAWNFLLEIVKISVLLAQENYEVYEVLLRRFDERSKRY